MISKLNDVHNKSIINLITNLHVTELDPSSGHTLPVIIKICIFQSFGK